MTEYQTKTRKILRECGAFRDGSHFVYNSGLHGDFYLNKDALYAHPLKLDDVCVMLTECALKTFGRVFDAVVVPATSGIAIGQAVAYNLSLDKREEVLFAFAERQESGWVFRRGFQQVIKRRNILLIDGVVTTGQTLVGLAQAVTAAGGQVAGALTICDRGDVRVLRYVTNVAQQPTELTIAPLVELDLKTFTADSCPFCKSGRPIEPDLGKGVL
jgi:orotate phosphoribosyltransferase